MAYYIGDRINKPAPHHESIQALWETKWKFPCKIGVYPFTDGKLEDFEPVFNQLIESDIRPPYDFDTYANHFFPAAEALVAKARAAENSSDLSQVCALYLRAAALYRIARFPFPRSPKQKEAWKLNKETYVAGAKMLPGKFSDVQVQHTHAIEGEGQTISIYMRLPDHASPKSPVPIILQILSLDGYRTESTDLATECLERGWGNLAVEIPGTGDCPALKQDPLAAERLWSSLLDWMDAQEELDAKRRVAWGLSTGGYYAMRLAHTHRERLVAVVAQGGGCHRMFDGEWIDKVGLLEYPFNLSECLAEKWGYSTVDAMKEDAMARFSLLKNGILNQPSTRLLLINGMNDENFPIEDSMLPLQHGSVKEARFVPGALHMGEPAAGPVIMAWLEGILGSFH